MLRGVRNRYLPEPVARGRSQAAREARLGQLSIEEPFEARISHKALTTEYKLAHGVPVNIYDAARAYRVETGQESVGIRAILKQADMREAWYTLTGSHFKGHPKTFFKDKLRAGASMGYDTPAEVIEILRNISP